MKRVLFICTHPQQFNGYSKVIYNILKHIDPTKFHITVYGFQKSQILPDNYRNDLQHYIYDAAHYESPKASGFNIEGIHEFIKINSPHIIFIFNDAYVIQSFISNFPKHNAKIIIYLDQVYNFTKKCYIDYFNSHVHHVCLFSDYWESHIKSQGLTVNTSVLSHGIDYNSIFYIDKIQACQTIGLDPNIKYLLNLNTNQPRKRYDIFIQAIIHFFHENPDSNLKVIVPFQSNGAFNIEELFDFEKTKYSNFNFQFHDIFLYIYNFQQLSDSQINIIYNATDYGINTCDGEGFGLCNFEHAYLKKPQIISNVGNFRTLFDSSNAIKIEPIAQYYVDSSRDAIGGMAQIIDYKQVSLAIENLYTMHDNIKNTISINAFNKFKNCSWYNISDSLQNLFNEI